MSEVVAINDNFRICYLRAAKLSQKAERKSMEEQSGKRRGIVTTKGPTPGQLTIYPKAGP
jgi:hypothetical protein